MVFSIKNIINALSFLPPPDDYEPKGFVIDFDINYGKTFDNKVSIINLKMFGPLLPYYNRTNGVFGFSTTFSLDKSIFDLYFDIGMIIYPFYKYISFVFDFGIGFSYVLFLNHLPYKTSAKLNIDIPIYGDHYITIGTGVQHRNAIRVFDYLNLNKNYYRIYNSFFLK